MMGGRDKAAFDRFRTPGTDCRMAAFWFWHRIPTPEESERQLADMAAKGIARVMIQARPALPIAEYLSPAYLAAYADAAARARRHGLRLTIYDEYGWMSGHGGGRTVAGADHLRERHLFWASARAGAARTELRISGIHSGFLDFLGEAGRNWVWEGGAPLWGDWQPVMAVMQAPDGVARPLSAPVDVIATGPTSCRIVVEHGDALPPGTDVTVFVAGRALTSRLINYLLPEAAQRFAEVVYAPLLAAAGDAADGFFFDHPYAGFYRWAEIHGALGNSILWDESLLFGDGADAGRLMALIGDDGTLRAAFLEDYANRLHEAFFGTLSRWTAARGLGFTGHELLTHVGAWGLAQGLSGFDPRTMPGLDYFGIDSYRTATAADSADYAPQLSARFAASVARANGRRRCIVEQYSTGRPNGLPGLAGQWGLTAETFRAQAARTIIFGARQIILHAVSLTAGAPGDGLFSSRFDFPPAFNFQPWWDDCPDLFTELARLSSFLDEGEDVNRVALFFPLETLREAGPGAAAAEVFGWWAEELARAGIGYDIIDERQLAGGQVTQDRYDTLILPAVSALRLPASVEEIAAFHGAGGQIAVSGRWPGRIGRDGECARRAADLARVVGQTRTSLVDGHAGVCAAVAGLPRTDPHLAWEGGRVWSSVQTSGSGWRIAAINDGDAPSRISLSLPGPNFCAERWDPVSGMASPVPAPRVGPLVLDLPAQGILCLVLAAEGAVDAPVAQAAAMPGRAEVIALDVGWTLQIGTAPPLPIAVDRGWNMQGFPSFSGTGIYRNEILCPAPPVGRVWQLQLKGLRETAELWCNGAFVGRSYAGDRSFLLPNTGSRLLLELRVRNTAANAFYAGTPYLTDDPPASGLTRPPLLVAVPDRTGPAWRE